MSEELATCGGKRRRSELQPQHTSEDFDCSVCLSLLLDPVVAPCGHDMCQHCYQRWASTSVCGGAVCPLCRCSLPSNLAVCLRLKKTIERLYPEASDKRRAEVSAQLAADPVALAAPAAAMAQPQLPTYPQGPYPPQLFAQWAAAAAPHQQPLFSAMFAAAQFMSSMQAAGSAVAPAQQPGGLPSVLSACDLHSSCSAVAHVEAGDESDSPEAPHDTPQRQHRSAWQSPADGADRLQVARRIIATLQQRGWHRMLGPKLADGVRLLELVLYRTAASREAYLDLTDLEARIVAAVQQRAAAAAARRARLEPADAAAPATALQQQELVAAPAVAS